MTHARTAVVLAAALIFVAPAHAGNNFGGTAVLSWSRVAVVSDLTAPASYPSPLYLLLVGVPDVRSLDVELKWSPNDLVGPCYYVMSADSTVLPCGRVSFPLELPGVLDEDSTYTWAITFDGASRSCVTYLVGGNHCDGKPASFCLISVKTLDSNGELDELAVLGNATVLGGTEEGCPIVAQDIYPHVAVAGGENVFTIHGRDLAQDTQVALVDDGTEAPASTVTVSGDTTAIATVTIPSGFSGALDVVVSTAQSSDTLRSLVVVADSASGLTPVWRLNISDVGGMPRASVIANEFVNPAYPVQFPLGALPIRRRVETAVVSGDRSVPFYSMEIAPLDLDPNGRPAAGGLNPLSSSVVSVNSQTGDLAVIRAPALGQQLRSIPPQLISRVVPATPQLAPSEEFLGWERSPDRSWLVARTGTTTQFFTASRSDPMLRVPGRSYEGTYSRDGRHYAMVVDDGTAKRWIVIAADGGILREGLPSSDALSQLSLSPFGDVLTFTREQSARVPSTTVTVDLRTGQERVLSALPGGTRYYSGDGRTMMVLRAYPGSLRLFDVSHPLNPVEAAPPFEPPDTHFLTGAVCDDGSLVAVQVLETDANPSRTLMRVLALGRDLQQRAVVATRTQTSGLQFEGKFLLVGTQRHPIPVYFTFNPTVEISLYDLNGM
jgi:hypothetical protein